MVVPFGFGVGDVIAVAQLARAICKRLSDSSGQLSAIRSEVAGLFLVLKDVEESMTQRDFSEEETKQLQTVVKGCQEVLDALSALVTKFSTLGSDSRSWKDKPEQVLQKLRWDQAEVKELRSRITSNVAMLDALNGSISRKQTQTSVTGISQHLEGVRLSQQHQKILDWLSPHDYSSEQSDTFARRQEGTGRWLLESPEFGTWVSGTKQTLFCPGVPGAGKSIMSSIVIDHLRNTFRKDNVGVAFIYFRYKVRMEQTPSNILTSLLRQLVQGHDSISSEASILFEAHSQNNSRPTPKEVCDLLELEASRYSKVFIVVDALDECSDTDGTRRDILMEIRTLQSKQPVYLIATSRLIPNIIHDFIDATRLDIRASEADVRKYIQGQLHRLPSCVARNVTLQHKIEREIVNAVDGMFLLAQLHLDALEDKVTPKAVNAAFADLPKGLDALDAAYNQALERINDQKLGFRRLADQALTWIVFALRPLTDKELQHALAVELSDAELDEGNLPDPNEVIAYCAGLVVFDEESQIIRLVHYTTQEYFVRIWERRSVECHTSIATICLAYLSFGDHAQVVAQINNKRRTPMHSRAHTGLIFAFWFGKYPLLEYSATYWTQHATGMALESMKPTALEFLSCPSRLNVASELLLCMGIKPQIWTPSRLTELQFAAGFGSKELVEALLNSGLRADAMGDGGSTPLHSAIERGDEAISKLLLNRDDVDVNSMSERAMTPLLLAVNGSYDTIVADLLAHPDIDPNFTPSGEYSPLSQAARSGYDKVVKLLLAHPDIDVNGRSARAKPLSLAAEWGYDSIVKMLLAHPDIEINVADRLGSTALHSAARWGCDETIKLLLTRRDIDINAVNSQGFTPALWAMRSGNISTCKLLLSQDHVLVHPPSHYPPSSDEHLLLAVERLWAMWSEGRLPEVPTEEYFGSTFAEAFDS